MTIAYEGKMVENGVQEEQQEQQQQQEEEQEPPSESNMGDEDEEHEEEEEEAHFCMVRPADIPRCVAIEKASYPPSEAASKSSLQYRQHHAAPYFRCVYLGSDDDDKEVIGFVCATRCHEFEHEAMSTHHPEGPLLAIHSVVVTEEHRRRGVATAMLKDYIKQMRKLDDGVQKVVLLAKKHLLSFYVDCGFSVIKPSAIVHGDDQWYDLELDLSADKTIGCPYYVVDAFANRDIPGSGNPAAVVLLDKREEAIDPNDPKLVDWMLTVAKEFNLSETAFVWEHEDHKQGKELHFHIRYYTPKMEVNLCGHATLASAGVLYRTLSVKDSSDTILVFHAKEDVLSTQLPLGGVKVVKKRPTTKIAMKFPSKQPVEITNDDDVAAVQKILWEAFKVPSDVILYMGLSDTGDVFVELTPESFEAIGYDGIQYDAFLEWDGYSRGVIVCCTAKPSDKAEFDETASTGTSASLATDGGEVESLDFLSRFFAPKAGINEDPATGSAHCALGPYFSKKLGKEQVIGRQASERGGILECFVDGETSVSIIGVAVQTMAGNLLL